MNTAAKTSPTIHVLLFLSHDQKPDPEAEVIALERIQAEVPNEPVPLATSRRLHGLTEGRSQVFVYTVHKHAAGQHEVLAKGIYRGCSAIDEEASRIAREKYVATDELRSIPKQCDGFVHLENFELTSGLGIGDLNGRVETGAPLTDAYLWGLDDRQTRSPGSIFGLEKATVYFVHAEQALTPVEAEAIVRAKRDELHDKVRQLVEVVAREADVTEKSKEQLTDVEDQLRQAGDEVESLRKLTWKESDAIGLISGLVGCAFERIRLLSEQESIRTMLSYLTPDESLKTLNALDAEKPLPEAWRDRIPLRGKRPLQGWFEAKLNRRSTLRVYYGKHAHDRSKLWILVSDKPNEASQDRDFDYIEQFLRSNL